VQVSLAARDHLTVTIEKQGDFVSHFERRESIEYQSCEDVAASIERLAKSQASMEPLQTATH
jgi:hypothetical protein